MPTREGATLSPVMGVSFGGLQQEFKVPVGSRAVSSPLRMLKQDEARP